MPFTRFRLSRRAVKGIQLASEGKFDLQCTKSLSPPSLLALPLPPTALLEPAAAGFRVRFLGAGPPPPAAASRCSSPDSSSLPRGEGGGEGGGEPSGAGRPAGSLVTWLGVRG